MTENSAAKSVDVATLRQWLGGDGEIAFLDVREEGQHGAGHPLLAVNAPSRHRTIGAAAWLSRRAAR
jgi:hypothetical protein